MALRAVAVVRGQRGAVLGAREVLAQARCRSAD